MKQVLVIEDNRDNLGLIRFALERAGYKVTSAETGAAGVSVALESSFDLIIVDINLPDFDGYEVTRRIRKASPDKAAPIVAITSNAMTGDREKTLAAGCDGYFEKPIDPITIVEQIEKAVGISRATK
ncbi:MAG: response receiver [uncultured bacterium]|uniref:Response receiver n=1 Tax=Citrifermentans bemidjiense (strain ATCC BAA-1014 / DSM 16622 / JCM 12645 / Bem) TaxID=404380 RepID=B5EGR0_CITBB|nr:response regulator [Citrifermentans bemidjiense]ACH39543.1 response receiver [Citrifermentans bemidjiense Bem]EKD59162.1 MAG: response receiver [uncultured bacterium]